MLYFSVETDSDGANGIEQDATVPGCVVAHAEYCLESTDDVFSEVLRSHRETICLLSVAMASMHFVNVTSLEIICCVIAQLTAWCKNRRGNDIDV